MIVIYAFSYNAILVSGAAFNTISKKSFHEFSCWSLQLDETLIDSMENIPKSFLLFRFDFLVDLSTTTEFRIINNVRYLSYQFYGRRNNKIVAFLLQ